MRKRIACRMFIETESFGVESYSQCAGGQCLNVWQVFAVML